MRLARIGRGKGEIEVVSGRLFGVVLLIGAASTGFYAADQYQQRDRELAGFARAMAVHADSTAVTDTAADGKIEEGDQPMAGAGLAGDGPIVRFPVSNRLVTTRLDLGPLGEVIEPSEEPFPVRYLVVDPRVAHLDHPLALYPEVAAIGVGALVAGLVGLMLFSSGGGRPVPTTGRRPRSVRPAPGGPARSGSASQMRNGGRSPEPVAHTRATMRTRAAQMGSVTRSSQSNGAGAVAMALLVVVGLGAVGALILLM